MRIFVLTVFGLVILVFGFWFFISKVETETKKDGPIIFFGDSITAGQGVGSGEAFPELIAEKLNKEVVNTGVSGDTTTTALVRLSRDVLSKKPSLVVIELGGNDFLQGVEINETTKNLEEIVKQIQIQGAEILLLGIKVGIAADKDYETVGRLIEAKYKINFEPNLFNGIFSDPKLMADQVHPNKEGHKIIAARLEPIIKKLI